ncbi:ATP-binding protein [Streptomyces kaniharaensis]|uniref:ATP-binding protein n=1 Tax=Streptomyces kaniharaensis TaxID=212423 RepID=UPI0018A7FD5A|nr:ATP-binding protein [Streptomyces kaniharaensis]
MWYFVAHSPVSEGRAFTRRTLSGWHLAPSVLGDDVQLIVSELLTNAARYTAGPLALDLDQNGPCLRITVTDPQSGSTLPDPGTHQPTRVGGHGLFIVDRLALCWGALPNDGGKARMGRTHRPLRTTTAIALEPRAVTRIRGRKLDPTFHGVPQQRILKSGMAKAESGFIFVVCRMSESRERAGRS